MPLNIVTFADSGLTTYAVIGKTEVVDGVLQTQYYNTVSGEFVSGLTNTFSWTASSFGLSSGTGDHYFGTLADLPAGQYWIETWRQTNASPNCFNDEIIGVVPVAYDGTQEIDEFQMWSRLGEIQACACSTNQGVLTEFQDRMLRVVYQKALRDVNNNNRSN
jgi:hypothetical protein